METVIQFGLLVLIWFVAISVILIISRILDPILTGIFRLLGDILIPLGAMIISAGIGGYLGNKIDIYSKTEGKYLVLGVIIGAAIGNIIGIAATRESPSPPPGFKSR
jgi:ethanolamine transporter EutH